MPHPTSQTGPIAGARGWGQSWGDVPWGGEHGSLGHDTGQVVRRRIGWARGERLISALGSSDPVRVAKL